ncbi:photosystem II reaction center PsbP family protein [Phormidium sp. CLA17]|uniref:photosystem II reaction center PsbP n=1 Tax=Leptolyngbya sp. Cla-17 TaxID=2803751 RepID=UPI0014918541|nr:photosystem II reaction center PsbP [Leptolyngbya sp. Cla-17]MBM0741979.1 photosystem II reaction center PsbP family protein [Leptolyngbya sp. Cla-17]
MLKRTVVMLMVIISLSLQGCVSGATGFKSFVDSLDGYQFLYPNGWLQVQVSDGPDVVFHDIIEQTENVSVVINPVTTGKSLKDLGDPSQVGYKLSKSAIAPPGSGREAELVNAEAREIGDKTYYLLEYAVKVGDKARHNLASVAVSRGKLYTLNASTTEDRWERMKDMIEKTVRSFSVY